MSEARLWVRLTHACNNRCLFCLDGELARRGACVPFEQVREQLVRGRGEGLRRVVLSGGEPTLHPRFVELVGEAARLGYDHAQVVTNGRRFAYPRFLEECAAAGLREATFSLHGHTPELHDRLVGVPGAFVQGVAGLRNALARPDLIVSVDIVLNRLNIAGLERTLRWFIALGVREFDLLQLVPFGAAWENWELLEYDPAEHAGELRAALALAREVPGLTLWTNRLAARHLEGFESLIQPPDKIRDEVRGRAEMFRAAARAGRPPDCRGPRCRFCFLEGFCADLERLRSRGSLPARRLPPCLKGANASPRARSFRWRGERDLLAFADYYIARRFVTRGAACARCALAPRCAGAPVALVRERGFGILRPLENGRG